jgi:hypothetical protein
MTSDLYKWAYELARKQAAETELRLITMIEEIEGRVPTNEEVAAYGQRNIYPDGTVTLTWRGKELFTVPPLFKSRAL